MTAIGGMLALHLMNHILIRVPEENNDGATATFGETERLDKEMIERWLGEADSTIIFVCARSTILGISPSKEHIPRLLCSRLSAQSPLLKATSGYHPIRVTRPLVYSMRRSTYSLKKSSPSRTSLRVASHSIEHLTLLRSTSYGSAAWSSAYFARLSQH